MIRKVTLLLGAVISLSLLGASASWSLPNGLSRNKPYFVDEAKKEIGIYAEVNGKYLHQPTRHGLNYWQGKYGQMSVFKAYVNQMEIYNALVKLGVKAGNNVSLDSPAGARVQGDAIKVSVGWDGAPREYAVSEVITDSKGKGFEFRFGGNAKNALEKFTGCMLCLDSCPVGITSNTNYGFQSFANHQVEFKGNQALLPADGTPVVVYFRVGR